MSNSMQHWNNNRMVAVAIQTTGPDPDWHEMCQVAFVALDSDCNPDRSILPLHLNVRVDYPERWEKGECTKKFLVETQKNCPFPPSKCEELLVEWIDRMGIKHNKYHNRKKLMIVCYDAPKLTPWIKSWLSLEWEDQFDEAKTRDIRIVSMYLNDYQGMHAEKVKFVKQDLSYLRNCCEIARRRKKDTLSEALLVSKIYNYMIRRGNG